MEGTENEGLMRPSTAAGGIEMGNVSRPSSAAPQMRMSVGGMHVEVIGADGVATVKEVKKGKKGTRASRAQGSLAVPGGRASRAQGSRAQGSRAMGSRAMGSRVGGADGLVNEDPWDVRRTSIDDIVEEDVPPTFVDSCMERAVPLGVVCCLFVGLPTVVIVLLNWSHFQTGAQCTTLTCPANYLPKDDMATLRCRSTECAAHGHENDVETCCDEKAKCSSFPCLVGFFDVLGKSSTRCQGVACTEEADLDRCCEAAGTCPLALSTGCPEFFRVAPASNGHACNHVWCEQEECCSATCQVVGCGAGLLGAYILADNGARRFCSNPERCDIDEFSATSDVPSCCAARCSSKICPEHHEQIAEDVASSTTCATLACDDPSDTETCCREHAKCELFPCPTGTEQRPGAAGLYCGGLVCDRLGDADNCCDAVVAI